MVSLAERMAQGSLRRIAAAVFSASSMSVACGTTRETMLHWSARAASMGSPVSSISSAMPAPQMFTSRTVPPSPWWKPRRTSN
jgi:hypothetical protein